MKRKRIIFIAVLIFSLSFAVLTFGQNPQQGEVNINAEVLEVFQRPEGGGVFISPSQPIVVSETIPGPPEIPKSLIINDGAVYTNSLDVTLSLSAENAFQMAISNTADFGGISWEAYQTSKSWVLTKGDGKKTVYVKFRSPDGGVSKVVSDSIILDTTPPANVRNFLAKPGDSLITLTWLNPPDEDFTGVKIQMSTKIYPGSPEEGINIYDDKDTIWVVNGLIKGVRYYFTAFSYDDLGNYASGAVASAVPTPEIVPPEIVPYVPPELVPKISEITLEDFSFSIEGVEIFPEEGVITVKFGENFKISIPVEKFPKVLKTIITVVGARTSSYLLRINPEGTAYEAIITAPETPGTYPMTIIIMDFKEGTVAKIKAQLKVEGEEERVSWTPLLILIILVLTVGVIVGYLINKTRQRAIKYNA